MAVKLFLRQCTSDQDKLLIALAWKIFSPALFKIAALGPLLCS